MEFAFRRVMPCLLHQQLSYTSFQVRWGCPLLYNVQQHYSQQMLSARSQSSFPVITVPKLMQQNLEKKKKREDKMNAAKRLEKIREESRKGNRNVCIVRCKNTHLNHYLGQSYPRSTGVQLASGGWRHGRSRGDHFTICGRTDVDSEDHPAGKGQPGASVSSFADLGLHADLVANLRKMGIVTPTEIQRHAVPRLLSGADTLVAAETGCGKTVAAVAPLLDRLLRQPSAAPAAAAGQPQTDTNRPRAIIVTPGRELATQIRDVVVAMAGDLPIQTRMLLGGRTKRKMEQPSLLPMDVLVASFGALRKLHSVGIVNLSSVGQVVLDEADTLLDDSFRDDLRHFLGRLPLRAFSASLTPEEDGRSAASLALLGATMPQNIDSLMDGLVLGRLGHVTSARLHRLLPHVQQTFLRLASAQRADTLLRLCREAARKREPVIVFSNNASTCDWVSLHLNENGVDCLNISGQQHYKVRQGRWHAFLSGETPVLSCTDLVSRGLDSCLVEHVINYDFPWNTSDYIHRAGRVGRTGSTRTGTVTSFVSRPLDIEMTQRIEKAARSDEPLWNVNANVKQIIMRRMLRKEAAGQQSSSRRRS